MNINRSLKLYVFVFIIVFLLGSFVLNFGQNQAKIQPKPDKPPGQNKGDEVEYKWKFVILESPLSSIQGIDEPTYGYVDKDANFWPGWLYDGSESFIDANSRVAGPIQEKFRTTFSVVLALPAQIDFTENISIKSASFEPLEPAPVDMGLNPDFNYKYCRFPVSCVENGINCASPFCVFDFLQNWNHPYPGYKLVELVFRSGWSVNPLEYDFEQMPEGVQYEIMDFAFGIPSEGIDDGNWKTPDIELFNTIFSDSTDFIDYGYYERLSPNVWKIVVGSNPSEIDYASDDTRDIVIDTSYGDIVIEQRNRNRTREVYKNFWPTHGICDMRLEVLFIREEK